MATGTIIFYGLLAFSIIAIIVLIIAAAYTVPQGTVSIITRLGKFNKISTAGLNFKIPFVDSIFSNISLQNRCYTLARLIKR